MPVTPRDLSPASSFSDEFSDEDSSDDSPGNDDKGKNDMSDVDYSDGESSTDETTYGALKRKRADPEPESHGKFLEPVTTDN